jgi:hypothetical protein
MIASNRSAGILPAFFFLDAGRMPALRDTNSDEIAKVSIRPDNKFAS